MIHSVTANRESFKPVELHKAFNVVLAERSEESHAKDSRNGSGKTSLLQVIHFCLGANADARNPLITDALNPWSFSLSFTARGEKIDVSRAIEQPARVNVSGLSSDSPVSTRPDGNGGRWLPAEEWRGSALGWLLFGIDNAEGAEPGAPSPRSLLSYFARRGRDAFSDPFTFFRSQSAAQRQILNAYLLGLDWRYPARAQQLRDQSERLKRARDAIAALPFGEEGTRQADTLEGELEARVILLSREVNEAAQELASFRVHPQYNDIEREASSLTREIHELSVENLSEHELQEFYARSLAQEQAATPGALEAVYAEAGVAFPEALRHRLEEVQDFHERLLANRREYLAGEMTRLTNSIAAREINVRELSGRRSRLMAVLGEHGALGEFQRLQDLHNERVAELERVRGQLEQLQRFEEELSRVRLARDQLVLDARTSFQDHRETWSEAVDIFGSNTAELYEEPGRLAVNVNEQGGLNLSVEIARGQSQGVQEMTVFCYDLMLAELWSRRETSPGFLIHDSTIFDGVDERQVARALQLAARKSQEHGFQYICLMNSDAVPRAEFDADFRFDEHVVLELSDLGEDGGLFGVRF